MNGSERDASGATPLGVARREMRPRERLVWADRPVVNVRNLQALGSVVIGLVFGGFAVFWTSAAWLFSRGVDDFFFGTLFPLFGLPFIAVGVGIVVSGIRSWRQRGSTVYALSDQRVLIIASGRRRTVRSVDLQAIRGVERRDGEGGVGTISLLVGRDDTREILPGIPEAARVGAEIERLRGRASAAGAPAADDSAPGSATT